MEEAGDTKTKLSFGQRIKLWWKSPKGKKQFVYGLLIILILVAAGYVFKLQYYSETSDGSQSPVVKKLKKSEPQITYTSPLDGQTYPTEEEAYRTPLGVMIENSTDARPQTGLDQASIVFEAIAEGGITRFLAVYGPKTPETAGPVRSARTYYVDWILGLNGFYSHVGGNMDALDQIRADKVKDLDQFAYSSPYWRDSSLKVATEHTMFTNTKKLYEIAKSKGWDMTQRNQVFKFKKDAEETTRPTSQKVKVNFSSPAFQIEYNYDPKTNTYIRTMAGRLHTDRKTNNQLAAKNIITMEVTKKTTTTRINENGWIFGTIGTGKARVFLDGKEIEATWKKESKTSRLVFYDSQGAEVELNPGQTWIEVVHSDTGIMVE